MVVRWVARPAEPLAAITAALRAQTAEQARHELARRLLARIAQLRAPGAEAGL